VTEPDGPLAGLFIVAPDVDDPDAIVDWYREHRWGGLFLQWRHLESRDWLAELVDRLRELDDENVPRPLLCVDEEGGLVSDVAKLTTTAPSPAALGVLDDPELTFRTALAMGDKLRALGFNLLLAPGLDIHSDPQNPVIGTRSFGTTPEAVLRHALPALEGYARSGMATCVKHFPGHGATRQDSHLALPVLREPRDTLEARELVPFRAAVDGGVPAVMTAHVAYPDLDPSNAPATLSQPILNGLLRGALGFEGVILTDDMEMKGVASLGDAGTVAVRALAAGCDALLYARDRFLARDALDGVADAVARGKLPRPRVAASLKRLHRLRLAVQATEVDQDLMEREEILDERHEETLRAVSAAGIGLVGGKGPDLPIPWRGRHGLFVVPASPVPRLNVDVDHLRDLVEPLGLELAVVGLHPTEEDRNRVAGRALDADYIVACTLTRGEVVPDQRRLIDTLVLFNKPLVLVSLLDPHDLAEFPSLRTRIATRGFGPLVLDGLVGVLTGSVVPQAV
jgi:beta-N-acetylhexosaminidase